MKQKIVIKVQMNCKKCRSKAMKIIAKIDGVTSIEMQAADEDQLMVIGDGVDSVKLTRSLRKKLRYATLLSVQEVQDNKVEKEKEKPKDEKEKENPTEPPVQFSTQCYCDRFAPLQFLVYEEPKTSCWPFM